LVVLHTPHLGKGGHVHYIELDQLIGANYLVTVHGPLNPAVHVEVALRDTQSVRERIEQGHLHPRTPSELSYAIVSALVRRHSDFVAELARKSGRLEQRVMLDEVMDDPEAFLDELFRVWYELLAVRTMAAHSSATYGRMVTLSKLLPEDAPLLVADTVDQFDRVSRMAGSQREFLHGVIEFYQARTDTHRLIAAQELAATALQQNEDMRKITAWVAIVAVPTAVTGFFGQNVPYPGFGERSGFVASALVIAVLAGVLYVLFKRKRWL
jgi:magnesium transporter